MGSVYLMGSTCPNGKGRFWVFFFPTGLNGVECNFETAMYSTRVRSLWYFRSVLTSAPNGYSGTHFNTQNLGTHLIPRYQ